MELEQSRHNFDAAAVSVTQNHPHRLITVPMIGAVWFGIGMIGVKRRGINNSRIGR